MIIQRGLKINQDIGEGSGETRITLELILVFLLVAEQTLKNIEDAIKEKQSIIRKKQNVTPKNGICTIKILF
jgi:hypothetical protein